MHNPNLRRWTSTITETTRRGFFQRTKDLFRQFLSQNSRPNQYILPSVLRAAANTQDLKSGRQLHNLILRSPHLSDSFTNTALIHMYAKCGRIDNARSVFDQMADRDLIAWNSMVSGYAHQGFVGDAFALVERMELVGVKPDLVTWNALIAGFAHAGDDGFAALDLFQRMQADGIEPDVVSWTTILSGFVRNFRYCDAFQVFGRMQLVGVPPSTVTISSLLPACANVANLRLGKEIHGYAMVVGMEEDVFVSSSLVDMYAKCGFIREAETLFYNMHERSVVSYNSMIFGYANHGHCEEAIKLFYRMSAEVDVKPDHLTFTATIMACGHAGLVKTGQILFDLMEREYGIEPRLEHYACMVDLLSRTGQVLEAYDLIRKMPMRPDKFVWGALLGACRNHGNVELAELAALRLFELEPESAGSCVLLSNLLAQSGRWEDATRLKKMAKRRKLRSVGCSWT